jgi:hypothetical protein
MSRADDFGVILIFFLVLAIELTYMAMGGYGPTVKDRGNMAATQEDVNEVMGSTMKILNGNF